MICEKCDRVYIKKYGSGRFCSRSCANSRIFTQESKEKIRQSITKHHNEHPIEHLQKGYSDINWNKCSECDTVFLHKNKRKRCDDPLCIASSRSKSGRVAAGALKRRSRPEIELFEYLNSFYFCNHNETIFNGWDADIIIPDLKLAILWNGPWHYKEMFGSHSLKQIINRDNIKLKEINKLGWHHISVKDYHNKMNSKRAFAQIIECIREKSYDITIL